MVFVAGDKLQILNNYYSLEEYDEKSERRRPYSYFGYLQ
jgi:hypothetical protein